MYKKFCANIDNSLVYLSVATNAFQIALFTALNSSFVFALGQSDRDWLSAVCGAWFRTSISACMTACELLVTLCNARGLIQ